MKNYSIKFTKIDKIVKKLKIIKLKKSYLLLESERLLKEIYPELDSTEVASFNVSLEIMEEGSGQEFEFDNLKIDFKENTEPLLSIITEDIYKSMETATEEEVEILEELADDLQNQLDEEQAHPEKFKINEQKGLSLNFFKKKEANDQSSAPYNSSWEEVTESTKEEQTLIETEEHKKERTEEPKTEIVFEDPTSLAVEYDDVNDNKEEMNSIPPVEITDKKEQQKMEYISRVNGTYKKASEMQKNSILSSLESYSDLTSNGTSDAIEVILTGLKEQSQKEEEMLLDHFNLKENSTNLSPFEQKKKAYLKTIKQPNFMLSLVSNFEKNVRTLENKASQQLVGKFQSNKELPLEEAIEDKLNNYKIEVAQKAQTKLNQVSESIENEHVNEKKQLEIRHENEMKKLELQQSNEIEMLDQRFTQKKTTEEEKVKKENTELLQHEIEEKKNEFLQNEIQKREEELLLFKKQILEGFSRGLQDIIKAVKETQESYYDDLEARLQENEEKWLTEVSREQRLQMRQAEQQISQESNLLKKQELEMLEKAKQKERNRMENKEFLLSEILDSNDRLHIQLQRERRESQEFQENIQRQLKEIEKSKLENISEANSKAALASETISEEQPKKKKRFILPLVIGICGLSLMGTTGYFGYSIYHEQEVKMQKQEKIVNELNAKLQEQLKTEKQNNVETVEKDKNKIPLATLLEESRYIEAADKYPDRLDEIEAQLFKDKSVNQLMAFNVLYKSQNGSLDQAILENNNEKIIQEYEIHEKKESLTKDQEKSIALAYFTKGNTEEGNQVLNGGK
ncbi:hypothetical protein [Carnobacterium divergens]|uniref:hypothetical protein n=1 Tax=Carnobacterium divergens TaxID=2748 RepID=UPI00288DC585|nr:hypothetical protein [Carnobacterium divergens]MDT2012895.1 hypothetical protein [Carnobacterium divergens]